MPEMRRKDPGAGAALGLIPGGAQFYVGETFSGVWDIGARLAMCWLGVEVFNWPAYAWIGVPACMGVFWGYREVVKHNRKVDALEASTTRQCPFCAERIQAEAKVCRYCQRDVGAAA